MPFSYQPLPDSSPGRPLDAPVRNRLEGAFGQPLSHVRVHTDVAGHLGGARAAAYGSHLLVRPEDAGGHRLDSQAVLAHEVAHVLQQRGSGSATEASVEADANRATGQALFALLSGRGQARPQLTTGLRLSRCNPQQADREHGEAQVRLLAGKEARVRSAAAATGDHGVTPKMVAGVLLVEMFFRNTAAGRIGESFGGEDPSLGWGQMKTSTALMALGDIPMVTATAATTEARTAARTRVTQSYAGVSQERQEAVTRMLGNPDQNIDLVATWLARLKNRPNRYPDMTTRAFGSNERACKIIATEYNLGPTDTAERDARSSDYGDMVWEAMSSSRLDRFAL